MQKVAEALDEKVPAIVSVFAGRIADTGLDPVPLMQKALQQLKAKPKAELLWASPREVFNVFRADAIGCPIITATPDILCQAQARRQRPRCFFARDGQMFYRDAKAAGYAMKA